MVVVEGVRNAWQLKIRVPQQRIQTRNLVVGIVSAKSLLLLLLLERAIILGDDTVGCYYQFFFVVTSSSSYER
jgi:hypothetical protein